MHKMKLVALLTLIFTSICSPVMANLIQNGGFEDTAVSRNSWAWFYASDVVGWSGSNIEIWDSFQGFSAFEGSQHAELNAHPSNGQAFSIFQSFTTLIGATYELSFAYSARSSNNEAFLLSLYAGNSTELVSTLIDDHEVKKWSLFNSSFVATDLTTTLRFTSVTPYSGTVGNFLDDIKVTESPRRFAGFTAQVPEPGSMLLVIIGLTFLLRHKLILSIKKGA
jgi:hypothetical protein